MKKNPVSWKACNILTDEVSTFKVDCAKLKSVIGWQGYQQRQGNGISNQGGLIIPANLTSRSVRKADVQYTNYWSGPVNLLARRSQEAAEHLLCRLWEGKHSNLIWIFFCCCRALTLWWFSAVSAHHDSEVASVVLTVLLLVSAAAI